MRLEVVGTQIMVHGAVLQHVVDGDQQAVGDCNLGTFLATTGSDAVVEGGVVAVGLASDVHARFDQNATEPAIALARPARVALAGTLVVAGTDLGPGGDVAVAWPAAHVDADLGQYVLVGPPANPVVDGV